MVWPAVSLYEPGIFQARDRTNKGMKTLFPSQIQQTSPPFGTPNQMKIHRKIFPCHAQSNWVTDKLVIEIYALGAAPSVLVRLYHDSPGLTPGAIECRAFGPGVGTTGREHEL
jgi:hypothetical protein